MKTHLTPLPQDDETPSLELARAYDMLTEVSEPSLWLANYAQNTQRTYGQAVAQFISAMGIQSYEELYGITQAHVIAWRDQLKAQGLSNTSVTARLSALSSLFKHLADKQLCKSNPVSGVRYPHKGHNGLGSGKTPTLTSRQVRAMLEAPDPGSLQGLRDRAILHVFFYTGGRCSEPGALKVRDFRMDREYWVLDMTIKGQKTNTVAIHTECQIAIHRYLQASGHGQELSAPLFLAVKKGKNFGQALSSRQFFRLFMKYARIAGLPQQVSPHSARATFITEAYEAGIAGEDIQRTVGHSSITTTEGYNHTVQRHRKSASFGVNY